GHSVRSAGWCFQGRHDWPPSGGHCCQLRAWRWHGQAGFELPLMLRGSSFGYLPWTIGNGEGSSRTKGLVRRAATTIDNSGGRRLQRRLTDRQLTAHLV